MRPFKAISVLLIIAFIVTGCAHPLKVKNISLYRPDFIDTQHTNIKLGIMPSTSTYVEDRLMLSIANNLKLNGFDVTNPFHMTETSKSTVDYIVKIRSTSEFKGSGSNFFRNFPGFLLWIPAVMGYKYNAVFNFDVKVLDVKRDQSLSGLRIPVDLDIRHANINRTWTEVSWLEFGIIAFVGGLVFIKYDDTVTPLLIDRYDKHISEYVSSKVSKVIISAERGNN
jgi:hypothetical protein